MFGEFIELKLTLDSKKKQPNERVRLPGFEPGYSAWEADVLPS